MQTNLPDRRLRLAFFGTPELAQVILQSILDTNEDDVALVVCQPDRPKGRGQKLEPPPVKVLAESRAIPLIQPLKMKDGVVTDALKKAEIDLAIVAAFGRILQQDTLDAPRFGCWNVHASMLPRHRGASPIQHAILCGDKESGVTLMQMTAGLDEGPMLLRAAFRLNADETTMSLTAKMAKVGSDVLIQGLGIAKTDGLEITPQDPAAVTYAPIIEKESGRLDLLEPAEVLERKVRALHPWPGTWIELPGGEPLRILKARVVPGEGAPVGTLVTTVGVLRLQTAHNHLEALEVQPAGKKAMSAADYLRGAGRALTNGMTFAHR